jgi:hypothetical protein
LAARHSWPTRALYIGNQAGSAAGQYGYLYKLDANVGTQCWRYRCGTSRLDVEHVPAVNDGVVFARHGGTFVGVAASNGQAALRRSAAQGDGDQHQHAAHHDHHQAHPPRPLPGGIAA